MLHVRCVRYWYCIRDSHALFLFREARAHARTARMSCLTLATSVTTPETTAVKASSSLVPSLIYGSNNTHTANNNTRRSSSASFCGLKTKTSSAFAVGTRHFTRSWRWSSKRASTIKRRGVGVEIMSSLGTMKPEVVADGALHVRTPLIISKPMRCAIISCSCFFCFVLFCFVFFFFCIPLVPTGFPPPNAFPHLFLCRARRPVHDVEIFV